MKTRNLLLLAVACGLAIMAAGVGLMLRLGGRDEIVPPASLGEPVQVGDMTVTVERSEEAQGVLEVEILIGGVDDPHAADGFQLIASGRPTPSVDQGEACVASAEAASCVLRFDTSGADTPSRVLVYRRGDEQQRWNLDVIRSGG